jgi:hypothetical protein
MNVTVLIAFLTLVSGTSLQADRPEQVRQNFDRSAFYAAMVSGDLKELNAELAIVGHASIPEKKAYEGALLMRKAGEVKIPADKLRFFRLGHIKLESALSKDSTNGEYHFLRLTIQEHAPRIVRYYKDLEIDAQYIRSTFRNLSPVVQHAIIEYSKGSKTLHPEEFDQKPL